MKITMSYLLDALDLFWLHLMDTYTLENGFGEVNVDVPRELGEERKICPA